MLPWYKFNADADGRLWNDDVLTIIIVAAPSLDIYEEEAIHSVSLVDVYRCRQTRRV